MMRFFYVIRRVKLDDVVFNEGLVLLMNEDSRIRESRSFIFQWGGVDWSVRFA